MCRNSRSRMTDGMRTATRAEWMKPPFSSSVVATPLSTKTTARRTGVTLMGSYDALSTSTGICSSRWFASRISISSVWSHRIIAICGRNRQQRRGDVRELGRGAGQSQHYGAPRARALQDLDASGNGSAGRHDIVNEQDVFFADAFRIRYDESATNVVRAGARVEAGLGQGGANASEAASLHPKCSGALNAAS